MSFPRKLKLFRAWAKAMELGATVDKPTYGQTQTGSRRQRKGKPRKKRRVFRRKRRALRSQDA